MMYIRPVERGDLPHLLTLATKTGGGLTSLPVDSDTLSARIERSIQTWEGKLPRAEQGYVFVLVDDDDDKVVGISALEVAVGLQEPWYNFRVGNQVHASKQLGVYNVLPTLSLSNDHTGSTELCTLFLDPDYRKNKNGQLLSKCRFLFLAAFRDRFMDSVIAEMRGVSDENGHSAFWDSVGHRFFSMNFTDADFLSGTGQKAFIAELMPKHPLYIDYLSPEAQAVISKVHPQTAPARALLESEGFRYRNYVDIFDGGATIECEIERVRAIKQSRKLPAEISDRQDTSLPLCMVGNDNYQDFRAVLLNADPDADVVTISPAVAAQLQCQAGDELRVVKLFAVEKKA